jgi:hypothetical protein
MDEKVRKYLSAIGQKGGKKSRRVLSPEEARDMVRVREARRAFKKFYARCFWSFRKEMLITMDDIPWVVGQLRKHGNREAWDVAEKLCR